MFVANEEFDNLDNPWGEIKLHRYSNIDSNNQTMENEDEIIPLKECNEKRDIYSLNY